MLPKCFFPGFVVQESSSDHGGVVMVKFFQEIVVNLHHFKTVKVSLACEDKKFRAFQFLYEFFKVSYSNFRISVEMYGKWEHTQGPDSLSRIMDIGIFSYAAPGLVNKKLRVKYQVQVKVKQDGYKA